MKLSLETRKPGEVSADVLIVGRYADPARLAPALQELDRRLEGRLARVLALEKFEGKAGQIAHFYTDGRLRAERVLVVGLGPRKLAGPEPLRRGTAAALRRARDLGAATAAALMPPDGAPARARAQAVVEGAILGTYRFAKYLKEKNGKAIQALAVVEPDRRQQGPAREGLRVGEIAARAVTAARDLVNEPANVVTPASLAQRAEELARQGKLRCKVLEHADCAKLGMGAFLGVAQGSQEPPKFIHLTYAPRGRARRRVVLVGKGITFDSGGLDLKTADGMQRMKDDMSGAAAVLSILGALPKLGLPIEVHGLVAATENMPSGTAQRPGDIVRAMNGTSIEIGNTDAEGRLTLADALAYAVQEIKPDEIVEMATLTGAVVVALGLGVSGVMGNHQGLADRLLAAARGAGEAMWQLPLHDEYREGIKSDVADLNNISSQRGGGAIVAALFMREFTGGVPWVHLDIAGTAFTERELPLGPKGGTGVGVRTVLAYLMGLGRRR
jgi:leucyl aminopeptidase